MRTPNKTLLAVAIGVALVAPGAAFALVSAGDTAGTDEASIRAFLEGAGYQVQSFEMEDDEIEVKVLADGMVSEIEIDPATGLISEIEHDDDEDDENDAVEGAEDGDDD